MKRRTSSRIHAKGHRAKKLQNRKKIIAGGKGVACAKKKIKDKFNKKGRP